MADFLKISGKSIVIMAICAVYLYVPIKLISFAGKILCGEAHAGYGEYDATLLLLLLEKFFVERHTQDTGNMMPPCCFWAFGLCLLRCV